MLGGGWDRYAGRLFRDNVQVGSLPYSRSPQLRWPDLEPGRYRVRVFARDDGDGADPTAETTGWVVIP